MAFASGGLQQSVKESTFPLQASVETKKNFTPKAEALPLKERGTHESC